MLYDLPEELQWHIWKLYHNKFVLAELKDKCEHRDATMIQNFIKNMIDEIISNAINVTV